MSMVNITEAQAPGMVLVDMETGKVFSTNVRLAYLPTYVEDAVRESPTQARAFAESRGVPVFAESDDLPIIAQTSLSI